MPFGTKRSDPSIDGRPSGFTHLLVARAGSARATSVALSLFLSHRAHLVTGRKEHRMASPPDSPTILSTKGSSHAAQPSSSVARRAPAPSWLLPPLPGKP